MVLIPAGSFSMGDDSISDNRRHTVTLSGYYMYRNLVTVAMYRKFCTATGRAMPAPPSWGWKEEHPIVNVTWDDAKAYCDWAGVSLPTEAQWEKAARGTDGRAYPWGNDFDRSRLWCSTKRLGDAGSTHAVGGFVSGASPYGVLDMVGNVWQWCADSYGKDYWSNGRAPVSDPVNDVANTYRVVRGGSWLTLGADYFRTSYRGRYAPSDSLDGDGFRCVAPASR